MAVSSVSSCFQLSRISLYSLTFLCSSIAKQLESKRSLQKVKHHLQPALSASAEYQGCKGTNCKPPCRQSAMPLHTCYPIHIPLCLWLDIAIATRSAVGSAPLPWLRCVKLCLSYTKCTPPPSPGVARFCSMDVDLTEQLKEAKMKYEQRVKDAAEAAAAATARREEADKTPSQGEVRRWQRSGRYSRKVSTAKPSSAPHL